MMSDYLLLSSVCLILYYLVDPFKLQLDRYPISRHFPFTLFLLGGVIAVTGHILFSNTENKISGERWQIATAGLPLLLLGLWMTFGSIYARNVLGTANTFMAVGYYMLTSLMVAKVVLISPNRDKIVGAFFMASSFFAGIMVLEMVVVVSGAAVVGDSYHELEAFIIPLSVYFALKPMKNKRWQSFLVFFFLAGGLLFKKNTGYIVMSITAAYLWVVLWRFRFKESAGFRKLSVAWLIVFMLVGVGLFIYKNTGAELLPSGNPQYRLVTYEIAWNKFLSSPLWGTCFTGSATEKFTGFDIGIAGNNLPSHSDMLDLAANGGLIALALWAWAYIRLGRNALKYALKAKVGNDTEAAAHTLACTSFASIFVYAFNPIMLQPIKALLLWWHFGLLIGITAHYQQMYKQPNSNPANKINVRLNAME
jgi:hypothetical protein